MQRTCQPWLLLSPTGLVYTVRTVEDLGKLADEAGVPRSNFKQLVGINENSGRVAQHKGGWQLLEKVWWIERVESEYGPPLGPIPFVSANGNDWIKMYFHQHLDCALHGARLYKLANLGSVFTGGRRTNTYRGWRKVAAPIDLHQQGLLNHVQRPSPFAPEDPTIDGGPSQASTCISH